jgi:hypothetical protein
MSLVMSEYQHKDKQETVGGSQRESNLVAYMNIMLKRNLNNCLIYCSKLRCFISDSLSGGNISLLDFGSQTGVSEKRTVTILKSRKN